MFVQVIQGRVSDPADFAGRARSWEQELRPGAIGFVGSTLGVTDDGTAIILAQFEDEQQAQRNSDRPEQGAWWAETEKLFNGEVTFRNSTDASPMGTGGSADAGFVQIMQGRVKDKSRYLELMEQSMPDMQQMRPDIIGGLTVWFGDNDYLEAIYFTSEAEAREAEKAMSGGDMPPEMAEFMDLNDGEIEYLDLRDPILNSTG